VLHGERALCSIDQPQHGPARLHLLGPGAAAALHGADHAPDHVLLTAYLGRDGEGHSYLLRADTSPALPVSPPAPARPVGAAPAPPPGCGWESLRDVGLGLDATDAGLFVTALALANWHGAHPRCSRCGTATEAIEAGWVRQCPACGGQHFPRTDPAVIMTVTDDEDRLLLGRQAAWPPRRYSTLAGFVEPGEPLEAAVRREVYEEAGIEVGEVTYLGSQPWPFPSSLMFGFTARALTTHLQPDGDELAEARWWTREEFTRDLASGAVLPPGPLSISAWLITQWYGRPLPASG
jgi:NAD+ diphosphatase